MTVKTSPPSRYAARALLDREHMSDGDRSLTFVASTAGTKRDGLDLDITGLRTENFEANPVFLWAHDYSGRTLPIGKVTRLRKLKSRLDATVEFDESDEFAKRVEQKYRDGFLNAVSIGWSIDEWVRGEDADDFDFRVTSSDLLDISAVPVPGDPQALLQTQRDLLASDSFVPDESGFILRHIPNPDGELPATAERAVEDTDDDHEAIDPDTTVREILDRITDLEQQVSNLLAEAETAPVAEVLDLDTIRQIRDTLDRYSGDTHE